MCKTKFHVLQTEYEQHIHGESSSAILKIADLFSLLSKLHRFCNVALGKRLKKDEPRLISQIWVITLIIHAIFLTFVMDYFTVGLTLMGNTKSDHVQRAHF